MKYEVKIVLGIDTLKSQNGKVLEDLVRTILERQEYEIFQNIHFTGLEIDLLARHRFKQEILYVECKAKEKPKSTEIKNFIYGVDYGVEDNDVDYGYFIYTEDLDKQAGALKLKIESNKKNITFIGPEGIIKLLINSSAIVPFPFNLLQNIVTKTILACTSTGYYYVVILQEGIVPTHAFICNAKDTSKLTSPDVIEELKASIKEIKDLNVTQFHAGENEAIVEIDSAHNMNPLIESITEIKESENWFDYAPASIHHFIGRTRLRKELIDFIENVRMGKTRNRIFYLDGKSGWGKSSVIAELRGRSKTKFWKNKLIVLAIDTRSAVTSNFVALSFRKLLDESLSSKFFPSSLFYSNLIITSPFDILSDSSVKDFFKEAKRRKKVLVLIFDQFEDIFRKEELFDVFYKFLLDVNDFLENLIIGFSWKSEINIPIGNRAYHLFSQLKDYSINLRIPEFSLHDVRSVLNQLEKAIGKPLGTELERRLIDASQGFPWLIKKLCIHTYGQYIEGKTIEELIEQDLNIKSLFQSDLEKLTKEESSILQFIAKRSFEENAFDISELDETTQDPLSQLVHKRLVIKTGTKYNIYWDIFRDYLVTGDIPVIGESYLIRQSPNACLDLLLIFKDKRFKSVDELISNYPTPITKKTLGNILFDLRSIGLIKRKEGEDIFELSNSNFEVSKEEFSNYVTVKFQNYTPYFELLKIDKQKILLDDIVKVLKSIFKTSQFRDETWKAYALNLVSWIRVSNLPIKNKISASKKGRLTKLQIDFDSILFNSPVALLKAFESICKGKSITNRQARDLSYLGLMTQHDDYKYKLVEPLKNLSANDDDLKILICNEALKFRKINKTHQLVRLNPRITVTELIQSYPDLVSAYKTNKSKTQIASVILSWGKFAYKIHNKKEGYDTLDLMRGKKTFFEYSSPKELKRIYDLLLLGKRVSDKYDRLKINLLLNMRRHFAKNSSIDNISLLPEYREFSSFKRALLQAALEDVEIKKISDHLNVDNKLKPAGLITNYPKLFENLKSSQSKYNKASKLIRWSKEIATHM